MDDRVDLGGPHDAVEDGVGLIDANELRPVEGHRRRMAADPDHDLGLGVRLERLDRTTTPEGVGPGDEDAVPHPTAQPNHTLRRSRSMSNTVSWIWLRICSASSMTRLFE